MTGLIIFRLPKNRVVRLAQEFMYKLNKLSMLIDGDKILRATSASKILSPSMRTCQAFVNLLTDGCQFSPCKRALLKAMPACRVARARAALKTASDAVFKGQRSSCQENKRISCLKHALVCQKNWAVFLTGYRARNV